MGIIGGIVVFVVFALIVVFFVLSKAARRTNKTHAAGHLSREARPNTEPGRTGDLD